MDLCHLQNSELETRYQKYEGRVVLRGDIVEDDSGSCAVFTEQGSSATQMTASKVMDILSTLPGCAGQAKQQTQYQLTPRSKWKMHRRYWKFQSQNDQIFENVYQSTNGQNHGPVWNIQSFLLKGICTVILWQDCYGKGNVRKFYQNTVGKKFTTGNVFCQPSKRTILICVCGRYQNGRQNRIQETDLENSDERRCSPRTNLIPRPRIFGLYAKRV